MVLTKRAEIHALLPVLTTLLVLSIESIVITLLELVILSSGLLNNLFLSYSEEFLNIVILTVAKGFGILVLVVFYTQKLRSGRIKSSSEIKLLHLLGGTLLYVGCITFLMQNLNNSLIIFPEKTPFFKVWPEIILSKILVEYMGYQIILLLALLIVIPIFEELLFRKVVITALLMKKMRYGWILIISSLCYAVYPFISNLVMYSEEQALWDFVIRLFSGIILSIIFIQTRKVKYTYLPRLLTNILIYIQFLTMFHPLFYPMRELYSLMLLITTSVGIIVLFYLIFDGIATYRSKLSIPTWLDSFLDFQISEDILKPLLFSIIFILPIIPFGLILFIDHLVLYTDLGGILIKTIIKSFFLGLAILICGYQIKTNNELFKAFSEPTISFTLMLKEKYRDLKENYAQMIRITPKVIFRHIGVIFLVLGAICPLFLFSMAATIFTRIQYVGTIVEVDMYLNTGQGPFFSFSRVEMRSWSPMIPIIPIPRQTEEMFYFLKHTNGQWNFLPDTFMAHPGDWIHGLMTVSTWFLILGLLSFVVIEYRRNRRITAGIGVFGILGAELLWYLFTMGLGSIPSGEEPPPPSTNQTMSQFLQMDFELTNFLILPLGLILFLIAATIILASGIWRHYKEKNSLIPDTSESKSSEELPESANQ
ncbi:MAG: type II CAAX prenyl endopeptidase Rce1 family protein [Promethearchaeota archaeon]